MDGLVFARTANGAVLTKVNSKPVHAVVPSFYKEQQVCGLGAYSFAQQTQLKSVTLPEGIAAIGDHAFYNCRSLEQITLHHGVSSIGDGAFKNCDSLCRISMQGMAYVKQFLPDFPHELTLTMTFDDGQTACLLFPEYDYEYLENVPPREFRSVTYGSGSFYRMCASNKAIDFEQYDRAFARAVREDPQETVQSIAFLRLMYPYQLSRTCREQYLAYLTEHSRKAAESVLRARDTSRLELMLSENLLNQDIVGEAISFASQSDFPEAVSLLMDYRLSHFGKRGKRFVL